MGNRRKQPRLADQRSKRHIKVADAARVVGGVESFIRMADGLPKRHPHAQAAVVALHIWDTWLRSGVMLRVDSEFAGALLDSDTDVELTGDWMDRMPFDAVGYSFEQPFSLHDGQKLCHYHGFLACGISSGASYGPETVEGHFRVSETFTRYKPIPAAEGARCVWFFTEDGSPSPQVQTVTLYLRGRYATGHSLSELIAGQAALLQHSDVSGGDELAILVPLSLTLLLYSSATDPEIDWPPADQIARPTPIKNVRVGNLGWRTGAALRRWRRLAAIGEAGARGEGWRLPPHIRKAHWHRVRVAERNEAGLLVGDRLGSEGVDWHYEVRWYPPTPVNADAGVAPVVRDL